MADIALQATWNEPVQAGQHFKNMHALLVQEHVGCRPPAARRGAAT